LAEPPTTRIAAHLNRTWERVEASQLGHVQRRLVQADLVHQALILAALGFSLLVPVLVTLAALVPLGSAESLPAGVASRLGLSPDAVVSWRLLLPGAIAMTVGLLALRVAAALFASAAIIHNHERYGPLGIVFVLLSWLVAFGVVMLGGPLLGAALHEHRVLTGAAQTPVAALGERGADDEPEAPRPPA
jgi:uncharacterized BrkB/YihY/UPF0761 family membrane protein